MSRRRTAAEVARAHRQEEHLKELQAQGPRGLFPILDPSTAAIASETPLEVKPRPARASVRPRDVSNAVVDHAAKAQAEKLGLSPLPDKMGRAAENGNLTAIMKYLRQGGDVNAQWTSKMNRTMLHEAVVDSNAQLVSALLQHRADPNLVSVLGSTPLMLAASLGDEKIVRQLLSGGASTSIRTHDGQTAMSVAQKGGKADVAELLAAAERSRESRETDSPRAGGEASGGRSTDGETVLTAPASGVQWSPENQVYLGAVPPAVDQLVSDARLSKKRLQQLKRLEALQHCHWVHAPWVADRVDVLLLTLIVACMSTILILFVAWCVTDPQDPDAVFAGWF